MPKDWATHKAELARLYITENKTLEEVREIMKAQGFDASIRSYRMRFDEWKLKKYKSKKKRQYREQQNSKSPHSDLQAFEMDEVRNLLSQPVSCIPVVDTFKVFELDIPTKALSARELEDYIPVNHYATLAIVLTKWRPQRQDYLEYLERLLEVPLHCSMILANFPAYLFSMQPRAQSLFGLVQKTCDTLEYRALVRILLRADIKLKPALPPHASWAGHWRNAVAASNWKEAKDQLDFNNEIHEEHGEIFYRTALAVLAESRLANIADEHGYFEFFPNDVRLGPEEYLTILKDFSLAEEFDVDKKWYKLVMLIHESEIWTSQEKIREAQTQQTIELDALRENNRSSPSKYKDLLSMHNNAYLHNPNCAERGELLGILPHDASRPSMFGNLVTEKSHAVGTRNSEKSHSPCPNVQSLFQTSLDNWRRGKPIGFEVGMLSRVYGYHISISSTSRYPDWSDWIYNNLSSSNQIPYLSAILDAFKARYIAPLRKPPGVSVLPPLPSPPLARERHLSETYGPATMLENFFFGSSDDYSQGKPK